MAVCQKISFMCDRIEVAERDWLACGLRWMSLGTLALGPFRIVARIARALFAFTISVHIIEAVYAAFRTRAAGLNPRAWFQDVGARPAWATDDRYPPQKSAAWEIG